MQRSFLEIAITMEFMWRKILLRGASFAMKHCGMVAVLPKNGLEK